MIIAARARQIARSSQLRTLLTVEDVAGFIASASWMKLRKVSFLMEYAEASAVREELDAAGYEWSLEEVTVAKAQHVAPGKWVDGPYSMLKWTVTW